MSKIDAQQFGGFIAQLRKEKGWTQRQLADQVFVSDKAVSKWERGLSLPDIELLTPIAEALEVTVTELLQGKRIPKEETLVIGEVEKLVSDSIELSIEEKNNRRVQKKKWFLWYLVEVAAVAAEMLLLIWLGVSGEDMALDLAVVEILPLVFGLWFFFFIREKLPSFYDREKISFYSNGIFRMELMGVCFNNRNWPHLLRVGRIYCAVVPVAYPVLYLIVRQIVGAEVWTAMRLALSLPMSLAVTLGGLLVPMIIVGKKYE